MKILIKKKKKLYNEDIEEQNNYYCWYYGWNDLYGDCCFVTNENNDEKYLLSEGDLFAALKQQKIPLI